MNTKGPWEIKPDSFVIRMVKGDQNEYGAIPYVALGGADRDVLQANAYLVAAAPDLLEALEELVLASQATVSWSCNDFENAITNAESAIAKAKGENQ